MADAIKLSKEDEASFTKIIDSVLAKSDLNAISASRIRKQLQETVNRDLTPFKASHVPLNDLIRVRFDKKYDEDQATSNGHPQPITNGEPLTNGVKKVQTTSSASPAPSYKRPPEDDEQNASSESPEASAAPIPKKKKKVKAADQEDDDAAFAARLQAEENRRGRSTRGSNNVRKAPSIKKKTNSSKKKSSAKVKGEEASDFDSDGDGLAEKKVNRNSAFHKPMHLSPALSSLFDLDPSSTLSRPQTVKRIWTYVRDHDLQDTNDKRMIICDARMRAVFRSEKIHMFTMNKVLSQNLWGVDE